MGNVFYQTEEPINDYTPNFWCELVGCSYVTEEEGDNYSTMKCKRCNDRYSYFHGSFTWKINTPSHPDDKG